MTTHKIEHVSYEALQAMKARARALGRQVGPLPPAPKSEPEAELPVPFNLTGRIWCVVIRDTERNYRYRSFACSHQVALAYTLRWNEKHSRPTAYATVELDPSAIKVTPKENSHDHD